MTEPIQKIAFDVAATRITVRDQAASESYTFFPSHPEKLHWSIPDPAIVNRSEIKINAAFKAVLNQLKQRIEKELLP